ncbi:MAG: 30S ribosomal protein THX [Bacteroidia bacterium]
MGKGDRRTRRGKLFRGTFGSTRKHKVSKSAPAAKPEPAPVVEAPKKKAPRKKKEE